MSKKCNSCGSEKDLSSFRLARVREKYLYRGQCRECERASNIEFARKNRLKRIWQGVMQRCYNPNDTSFEHYGKRGIAVEPRWHEWENFRAEMEADYSDDLEIDRIDVEGDYSKVNCRWVTRSLNNHNRRKSTSTTSRFKGVCWDKSKGKYAAQISTNNRTRLIGRFASEVDAAIAYDNASEELYGDRPNGTCQEAV